MVQIPIRLRRYGNVQGFCIADDSFVSLVPLDWRRSNTYHPRPPRLDVLFLRNGELKDSNILLNRLIAAFMKVHGPEVSPEEVVEGMKKENLVLYMDVSANMPRVKHLNGNVLDCRCINLTWRLSSKTEPIEQRQVLGPEQMETREDDLSQYLHEWMRDPLKSRILTPETEYLPQYHEKVREIMKRLGISHPFLNPSGSTSTSASQSPLTTSQMKGIQASERTLTGELTPDVPQVKVDPSVLDKLIDHGDSEKKEEEQ